MPTWGAWPDDIVTDEVVTAAWLTSVSQSFAYIEEINYTEFITDVSITATTVGTANQIVSSGAITYQASPTLVEFYVPRISSVNADVNVILRDGTTVLGTLAQFASGASASAVCLHRYFTPTAASHTYNIAAWLGAADTVIFDAGSGGVAGNDTTFFPGLIRISRVVR